MAGLNKVMIIGNLGRDPEMRYTASGSPVTNFTVAVNRTWNSREGEPREETEWFSVEFWDKQAETANQYLTKGKQVYVEGRIKLDTWDDRNTGEKRSRLKIVGSTFLMLGQRGEPGTGEQGVGAGSVGGGYEPSAPENPEFDNMPF